MLLQDSYCVSLCSCCPAGPATGSPPGWPLLPRGLCFPIASAVLWPLLAWGFCYLVPLLTLYEICSQASWVQALALLFPSWVALGNRLTSSELQLRFP